MTCRPDVLTCRWVNEITEAIYNVCPTQKNIVCKTNPEKCWKEYYSSLSKSKCINNPIVKSILSFEIDYNIYRNNNIYNKS